MNTEMKKTRAELLRVQASKAEMEYVIAQKYDEIKRVEDNIKKQEETEKVLQDKLNTLGG